MPVLHSSAGVSQIAIEEMSVHCNFIQVFPTPVCVPLNLELETAHSQLRPGDPQSGVGHFWMVARSWAHNGKRARGGTRIRGKQGTLGIYCTVQIANECLILPKNVRTSHSDEKVVVAR